MFSRLGGKQSLKREATSTSLDLDSDEDDEGADQLAYAGIFKNTLSPAKKPKVPVMKKITITKQVTGMFMTSFILLYQAELMHLFAFRMILLMQNMSYKGF